MIFGIIGYGRFGKLWAELVAPFGEVKVYDRHHTGESTKGVRFVSLEEVVDVDMLFLLVPISAFRECCVQVAPLLKPHTVVVDACSVKVVPAETMLEVLPDNQPLIATHPLFGPDSVAKLGAKGAKIVLSPLRVDETQQKVFEDVLEKIGLDILHTTPKEHDKQMARSQAVVHFIGRGLSALHLQEQEIATPAYKFLLDMNKMVENDTWQLFQDMQTQNPYAKEVRIQFMAGLRAMEEMLELESKRVNQSLLTTCRQEIDRIDSALMQLLKDRLAVVDNIANLKRELGIQIEDKGREREVILRHQETAKRVGVSSDAVEQLFSVLFSISKARQSGDKKADV